MVIAVLLMTIIRISPALFHFVLCDGKVCVVISFSLKSKSENKPGIDALVTLSCQLVLALNTGQKVEIWSQKVRATCRPKSSTIQ